MKIIQVSSASSSFSVMDYRKDIFIAWNAQIAFLIKKYFPDFNVEGWTIERKFSEEKELEKNDVKIRVFPTNLALRHGMEISFSMIKSLLSEQEKAKKNNEKLIVHLHEHHTWQSYLTLFFLDKKVCRIISQHHGARSPIQNLRRYKKLYLILPLIMLMQLLEKILFKKIDVIYGLTSEEISYLEKIASSSIVRFQTLGIGKEYFDWKIDKKASRKKLGLDLDKKYALFLGRIATKKGIRELLEAMEKVNRKDLELLLIGKGIEYGMYKSYANKKNLKNVRFLGSIYDERKMHYLSACDFLILPSYTEGCPIVLMEASAMNLLVVASKVGGIPSIIKNGREGILIEPESTNEIIRGLDEVLKLGKKNIRRYAKRYNWTGIIKQYVEDYYINK